MGIGSRGKATRKQRAEIVLELMPEYPLKGLLRLAGLARSTYYYIIGNRQRSRHEVARKEIMRIFETHKGRYGYRRICEELRRNGHKTNHKTVQRLMRELGLKGKCRKAYRYRSYKGEVGKTAENLLDRKFGASRPYEKLTTDITQFDINGTKVYLSPVMDLYSREILAYDVSLSAGMMQIRNMLRGLFSVLPEGARPLFHSDQGWQYQHEEYRRMLREHGISQSMSRKGNCLDNSVMENFFGRLKTEMYYGERFRNVKEFIKELKNYIEYYNNDRISLGLNGMSPVQYRLHYGVQGYD